MTKRKPRMCANGCDAPVAHSGLCICRACVDKITATLEDAVKRGKELQRNEDEARKEQP